MPRFVNLPTKGGFETSVRSDAVESVSDGTGYVRASETDEFAWALDLTWCRVVTKSGSDIHVALPKPRVMELLGLHLTSNGEEWV